MKPLAVLSHVIVLTLMLFLISCQGAGGNPDVPSVALANLLEDEDNAFETGMKQTGIIDTLRGAGQYTLFLPDTDAFARVLREAGLTEEAFLRLDDLKQILSYHVVIGTPQYPEYEAGMTANTLAGAAVKLRAEDQEHAFVNDIRLTSFLNDTTLNTNGEYEVIDGLLLPSGVSLR